MITTVTSSIYRGPYPDDLAELKRRGVTTILSLETGAWDAIRGKVFDEDEEAEKLGINVIHVQLSNFRAPTLEQVVRCIMIISRMGEVTYVHCKHGVDRTGFIIAAYRVLIQEWPVDVAISEWKRMGFHEWFYFNWPAAFRKLMAEMRRPNPIPK